VSDAATLLSVGGDETDHAVRLNENCVKVERSAVSQYDTGAIEGMIMRKNVGADRSPTPAETSCGHPRQQREPCASQRSLYEALPSTALHGFLLKARTGSYPLTVTTY